MIGQAQPVWQNMADSFVRNQTSPTFLVRGLVLAAFIAWATRASYRHSGLSGPLIFWGVIVVGVILIQEEPPVPS